MLSHAHECQRQIRDLPSHWEWTQGHLACWVGVMHWLAHIHFRRKNWGRGGSKCYVFQPHRRPPQPPIESQNCWTDPIRWLPGPWNPKEPLEAVLTRRVFGSWAEHVMDTSDTGVSKKLSHIFPGCVSWRSARISLRLAPRSNDNSTTNVRCRFFHNLCTCTPIEHHGRTGPRPHLVQLRRHGHPQF